MAWRFMSWWSAAAFMVCASTMFVDGVTWFGAATAAANAWGFVWCRTRAARNQRIIERAKGEQIGYV